MDIAGAKGKALSKKYSPTILYWKHIIDRPGGYLRMRHRRVYYYSRVYDSEKWAAYILSREIRIHHQIR